MASMVVMECSAAALTGITQDRRGTPSRCTGQAPHNATPQPNLVPFMPSRSRKTHSRGMSGSASTECDVPLICSVIIALPPVARSWCSPSREIHPRPPTFASRCSIDVPYRPLRAGIGERSAAHGETTPLGSRTGPRGYLLAGLTPRNRGAFATLPPCRREAWLDQELDEQLPLRDIAQRRAGCQEDWRRELGQHKVRQ